MTIFELIKVSFSQLRANRLRSFLTLLGIVIGVWFVITIVSVMDAFSASMIKDSAGLSIDVFQIQKHAPGDVRRRDDVPRSYYKNIKKEMADIVQKNCPNVLVAAAEAWDGGVSYSYLDRKTHLGFNLAGGQVGFIQNNTYKIDLGRDFTESDIKNNSRVIIIGDDVRKALFYDRNPLGEMVKVLGNSYKIIGTMEKQESGFDGSKGALAVVPLGLFEKQYGKQSVNITLRATSFENMPQAIEEAEFEMRKLLKTKPGRPNNFYIRTNENDSKDMVETLGVISIAGTLLGAVALLVGGIGVMNIMLASVKERTKEIGIRKSLGAKKSSILFQFLFESSFLSLLGCLVGIFSGGLTGFLVSFFMGVEPLFPLNAIIVAVTITSIIGVGFGSYPAWKASRLDPIEALRYE